MFFVFFLKITTIRSMDYGIFTYMKTTQINQIYIIPYMDPMGYEKKVSVPFQTNLPLASHTIVCCYTAVTSW